MSLVSWVWGTVGIRVFGLSRDRRLMDVQFNYPGVYMVTCVLVGLEPFRYNVRDGND